MICWLEQMRRGWKEETTSFPLAQEDFTNACAILLQGVFHGSRSPAGLKKKSPSRIGGLPKCTLLGLVDLKKETNNRFSRLQVMVVSRFLKNAESSILLYGCDNFSQKMYEENRKTSDHCLWLVVLCSKSYSDFLRLPDWFLMPLLKNGPGMPSETRGTTLCLCAG